MGGEIPISHNHSTSICWGYAQGRAFGKDEGDIECDPNQTWTDKIDESYFPLTSDPTLAGVTIGDIIVWEEDGKRFGLYGHAAYVTGVPGGGIGNIQVRNVRSEDGDPVSETVQDIINWQGSNPIGYHRGGTQTVQLTFKNSFNGGTMYVGKDKFGGWIEVYANPSFSHVYAPGSNLEFKAITPQWHGGYKRIFQYWAYDGGTDLARTITVPSSPNTYVAEFLAEYHVTAQNQFGSCVSGNPGVIKVGGSTRNSPHEEIVMEQSSVTLEAVDQTYDGVEYDFSQWSDGNGSRQRMVQPNGNETYTALLTVDKPETMSNHGLYLSSSPGQYISFAWNQHPDANVKYQVWRREKPAGGSLGPPVLLTTLNNNVTSWTDYDYLMTSGYTHDLLQYDIRSYYSCGGTTAAADDDYITVFGDGGIIPKPSAQTGEWAFTARQPDEYGHAAFPNPFNPATTISYQLVDDARVSLAVFDIRGRLIHTLVEGERPAGYHSVIW